MVEVHFNAKYSCKNYFFSKGKNDIMFHYLKYFFEIYLQFGTPYYVHIFWFAKLKKND